MYVYTQGHSRISGTGAYLPDERITTEDIMREINSHERFGISYSWLERVTGIREKRIASPDLVPSDMAVRSAREAMDRAKLTAHEIDVIIYAGLTRDYLEPATAHVVQAKLGATNATVFDVSNACHGFMNGIHVMDALIATGQVRRGLVVTGEQGSALTRRAIQILKGAVEHDQFKSVAAALTVGDAGAATVLEPKQTPDGGLVAFMLQSQGQHAGLCTVTDPLDESMIHTDMPAIVDETAQLMSKMFREFMYERLRWQIKELAKYLVHQVGSSTFRIYSQVTGVPTALMPRTVDFLGNLITASIPLNIHRCASNRELRAGDKIYVSSTGSGISLSQAGLIWDCL